MSVTSIGTEVASSLAELTEGTNVGLIVSIILSLIVPGLGVLGYYKCRSTSLTEKE